MNDQERLEELWRICFGDSNSFIRLFFDHVYKDENTLLFRKSGRIVSALFAIPYQMILNQKIISTAYICGVSTDPQERNKGYMSQLLNESVAWLKEKNYRAATLMPAEEWLYDYYASFGYEEAFLTSERQYIRNASDVTEEVKSIHVSREDAESYFPIFSKLEHQRSNTVLHSSQDFHIVLDDLYADKGEMVALVDDERQCLALGFVKRTKGSNMIVLKEQLHETKELRDSLFNATTRLLNVEKLNWIEPDESSTAEARGMILKLDEKLDLSSCINHAGSINLMLD